MQKSVSAKEQRSKVDERMSHEAFLGKPSKRAASARALRQRCARMIKECGWKGVSQIEEDEVREIMKYLKG